MEAGTKEDVFTLDTGDVVIHWPERIDPEEVKDIESWMKMVVRKMKRAAQKAPGPEEQE